MERILKKSEFDILIASLKNDDEMKLDALVQHERAEGFQIACNHLLFEIRRQIISHQEQIKYIKNNFKKTQMIGTILGLRLALQITKNMKGK